jgi:hypothetical protein
MLMQDGYSRFGTLSGANMINMKLWIGNISPGTSDYEIREFVKKDAPDLECVNIQRLDGDGSRPAATLEFADTPYVEKISCACTGCSGRSGELFVQTLSR